MKAIRTRAETRAWQTVARETREGRICGGGRAEGLWDSGIKGKDVVKIGTKVMESSGRSALGKSRGNKNIMHCFLFLIIYVLEMTIIRGNNVIYNITSLAS